MASSSGIRRIGITTGGGDCPGLNAVVRAVVKSAMNVYGWEVIGMTRSARSAAELHKLGVEPILADVFDLDGLTKAVVNARARIIVHQLTDLPDGLDPAKMAEARIRNARIRELGTFNLVQAAVAGEAERMVAQSIAFAYAPAALPYSEDSPLDLEAADAVTALSARAVHSLERQVTSAPFAGIALRYGRLYGPGTGFDMPPSGGPLHVDAAADAARRAITRGRRGVYNVAENDGFVSSLKAEVELGWSSDFRIADQR